MNQPPASAEAQLRAAVEELTEGVRTKDVPHATAPYADANVMFLPDPSLHSGNHASGDVGGAEWFANFRSDTIGQESRELTTAAGPEVAFVHRLLRISAPPTDGTETSIWVRGPLGFRKRAGQ